MSDTKKARAEAPVASTPPTATAAGASLVAQQIAAHIAPAPASAGSIPRRTHFAHSFLPAQPHVSSSMLSSSGDGSSSSFSSDGDGFSSALEEQEEGASRRRSGVRMQSNGWPAAAASSSSFSSSSLPAAPAAALPGTLSERELQLERERRAQMEASRQVRLRGLAWKRRSVTPAQTPMRDASGYLLPPDSAQRPAQIAPSMHFGHFFRPHESKEELEAEDDEAHFEHERADAMDWWRRFDGPPLTAESLARLGGDMHPRFGSHSNDSCDCSISDCSLCDSAASDCSCSCPPGSNSASEFGSDCSDCSEGELEENLSILNAIREMLHSTEMLTVQVVGPWVGGLLAQWLLARLFKPRVPTIAPLLPF